MVLYILFLFTVQLLLEQFLKLLDLFLLPPFLQTVNTSSELPTQMRLGLLSPLYLRKLFERMGATYIKLGQVISYR